MTSIMHEKQETSFLKSSSLKLISSFGWEDREKHRKRKLEQNGFYASKNALTSQAWLFSTDPWYFWGAGVVEVEEGQERNRASAQLFSKWHIHYSGMVCHLQFGTLPLNSQ